MADTAPPHQTSLDRDRRREAPRTRLRAHLINGNRTATGLLEVAGVGTCSPYHPVLNVCFHPGTCSPLRVASAPSRRSTVTSFPKQRGLSPVNGAIQDGSDAVITPATPRSSHP